MILLIDNYDSFTYNLYQDVLTKTRDVTIVRNDKITIKEISAYSPRAIILSPGPGRPEEAGICIDCVKFFSGQIPILGVCLGHQAIGAAFGSQITTADSIMHGKTSPIFHHRQSLFKDIALPFTGGRYHSLIIKRDTLSKELNVIAETADGTIMAIQHRTHPTFGIQFHPESILTDSGSEIINNFLQKISLGEKENDHPFIT
jgi:anthranilate synthase component II